jgi:starvation-inducible outer membrane lipoprotein
MRGNLSTLLVLALLIGCSEKPPFATDRPLDQTQLAWYVKQASTSLTSTNVRFGGGVDQSKPATARVSSDTNTVEVVFQTQSPNRLVVVRIDLRTGKVKGSDGLIVDNFR